MIIVNSTKKLFNLNISKNRIRITIIKEYFLWYSFIFQIFILQIFLIFLSA